MKCVSLTAPWYVQCCPGPLASKRFTPFADRWRLSLPTGIANYTPGPHSPLSFLLPPSSFRVCKVRGGNATNSMVVASQLGGVCTWLGRLSDPSVDSHARLVRG